MERALIAEFEAHIDQLISGLTADNVEQSVQVVNEYLEIRGYGPVKEQAAADARARIDSRMADIARIPRRAA